MGRSVIWVLFGARYFEEAVLPHKCIHIYMYTYMYTFSNVHRDDPVF